MKILYVARHGQVSTSNDDEGAIAHALGELGHVVLCIPEGGHDTRDKVCGESGDLLLFHKWYDPVALEAARRRMPVAFWYFDLVSYRDEGLRRRNYLRENWMRMVLPHVTHGFCTDGDWVAKDTTRKLHYLPQGADERVVGRGDQRGNDVKADAPLLLPQILFTGSVRHCGWERARFVQDLDREFGSQFVHIDKGVYGRRLADLIARSAVVVAPYGPVTPRYFSNRAVLMLGYGGFLLHPRCAALQDLYDDGKELVYYNDAQDLFPLIRHYLSLPEERQRISEQGLVRTRQEHLYRHRMASLLEMIMGG